MQSPSTRHGLEHLNNDDLLAQLLKLSRQSNQLTTDILLHLAEVDLRKLYLAQGTGSLFTYCVSVLNWSENTTYKRLQAARAARRFPEIFELVASGELHLSAVSLLAPHLTQENCHELLTSSRRQSKRAVEQLVATRFPRPSVPASLRKLPAAPGLVARLSLSATQRPAVMRSVAHMTDPSTPASTSTVASTQASASTPAPRLASTLAPGTAPAASTPVVPISASAPSPTIALVATVAVIPVAAPAMATALGPNPCGASSQSVATTSLPSSCPSSRPSVVIEPLSAERYRLQLTLDGATRDKLLHAQALLRHSQPDGDLAKVLDRALDVLVAELERRKLGKRRRPANKVPEAPRTSVSMNTGANMGKGTEDAANAANTASAASTANGMKVTSANTSITSTENATGASTCIAGTASTGTSTSMASTTKTTSATHAGMPAPSPGQKNQNGPVKNGLQRSRHIPNHVRRVVAQRDDSRCTFVGVDGRRCEERGFLEFHHDHVFAKGGPSTVDNVRLLCAMHNGYLAERDFGHDFIEIKKGRGRCQM